MRTRLTLGLTFLLGLPVAAQEQSPVAQGKPAASAAQPVPGVTAGKPVATQADRSVKEGAVAAKRRQPVSFWMEKKLEYSQEMLRGLATGDLEHLAKKAGQMRAVSGVEGWIRRGMPGYRAQLQAFNFANAEIERHAKADNLEGAAIAFQQLTTSCVSCHAILRNRN